MARRIYKYGLYGRCPSCKRIYKITCKLCGEQHAFTDSSKPGYVVCTSCKTYNKLTCSSSECKGQSLVIKTPKDEDEKHRIDEYIRRLDDPTANNRRNYHIHDTIKKTKVIFQKEKKVARKEPEVTSAESIAQMIIQDIKDVEKSKKESVDGFEDKTADRILFIAKDVPDEEEKEKRIVNQFFDEKDSDKLDRKIYFGDVFDEEVFYDCPTCKRQGIQYVCPNCGGKDKFSLKYDALRCSCGKETKIFTCSCGHKHTHSQLYHITDGVKWKFSEEKSYYEYRKGRMLVFSTCGSCGIFKVEKCSSCGSTVNFGKPNSKNEVYCKNCGTINQFTCDNPSCNNTIKTLKNPSSIQEKLRWLEAASKFKDIANKRKEISTKIKENENFSFLDLDENKITEEMLENVQRENQEIATDSFISDIKKELEEKETRENELKKQLAIFNKRKIKFFVYSSMFLLIITVIMLVLAAINQKEYLKKRGPKPKPKKFYMDSMKKQKQNLRKFSPGNYQGK